MRTRPGSLFAAFFLLLPALALGQQAQSASPLAGVWVPGELLAALEAEEPREIPCYLVIESAPLEVLEDCGGGRTRWTGAVLEAQRAGRVEVRAGTQRRLVFRAGTPNELELLRVVEGEEEFLRLYRLPAALEERLRAWAAAQQILVGTWNTPDGAEVEFGVDGSYRLAQERGRFRLAAGSPTPGAWGVLLLEPEGVGAEARIYLLTGAGRRVGLALPPAHLVPGLRARFERRAAGDAGAGGAVGQEPGMRPGQEPGMRPGQEPGMRPGQEPGMRPGQEPGMRPGQEPGMGAEQAPGQLPGAAGGGVGAGAAPGAADEPDGAPLQPAPKLEVAIWLERAGPGVEQQPTAPAAPEAPADEEEAPAEVPPIAQPIEPRGRCGCDASAGALGLALLPIALAPLRRRRHHRRQGEVDR